MDVQQSNTMTLQKVATKRFGLDMCTRYTWAQTVSRRILMVLGPFILGCQPPPPMAAASGIAPDWV